MLCQNIKTGYIRLNPGTEATDSKRYPNSHIDDVALTEKGITYSAGVNDGQGYGTVIIPYESIANSIELSPHNLNGTMIPATKTYLYTTNTYLYRDMSPGETYEIANLTDWQVSEWYCVCSKIGGGTAQDG